jgi:inorganic pyrophosphatase
LNLEWGVLEKKKTGVEGWRDREVAIKVIKESQQRYQTEQNEDQERK